MKAVGVVRKIDELGRIVIPKEIRDTNKWDVGTPMEVFVTDDGAVVFREYKALEEEQKAVKALYNILETTDSKEIYNNAMKALQYIENY